MYKEILIGLYGKLPAHGDFIHRNLPTNFVHVWDEWLQHFIAGSQEQIGDSWLNVYLTSPIWRFVFSSGVVDAHAWAGIMIPSVDRVGRYFPFSIVMKLSPGVNPMEYVSIHKEWFSQIETLVLQALDGQMQVDDLLQQIEQLDPGQNTDYAMTGHISESNAMVIDMAYEEQMPSSVYCHLLDSLLLNTYSSYSTWTTQGSEGVNPCLFTTQGLPPVNGIAAMIDGQWEQRNWLYPYRLNDFEITGLR